MKIFACNVSGSSLQKSRPPAEAGGLEPKDGGFLLGRHDHFVDHVDHAVGGEDVGDDHLGIIDVDLAAVHFNGDRLAVDGVCAGQLDHIRGHYPAGNYMVGQDCG